MSSSLIGPSGNTGVFIAPNEALYLYARTGNLILQSSDVFLSGFPAGGGSVLVTGAGGRLLASGTTATELGRLSGIRSSVQEQIDGKVSIFGQTPNTVLVTSGCGAVVNSTVNTTELGYLSGLTNNIQGQLNNLQQTITLNPEIVPITNATGTIVSSAVSSAELQRLSGIRSSVQGQIDSKQDTVRFASGTNRVVVTDATGNLATSAGITTAKLNFLDDVTSNLQAQLNARVTNTFASDRVLVSNGTGRVVASDVPVANLAALDSLRGIASNVSGQLFVSGRLGVLKSNPATELDVNGTISATSMSLVGGLSAASAAVQSATVSGPLTVTSSATVSGTVAASTVSVSSLVTPTVHNTVDLGTSGIRFKDLYVQGTIYAPSVVSTTSTASSVFVADNNASATPQYLLHVPGTSGEQPPRVTSSRLWFFPASGNLHATRFVGDLVGTARDASRWTDARTLSMTGPVTGCVSIDGTQNVVLSTSITNDSIVLGTHTTGPYVSTVSAGSGGVTVTGGTGESAAITVSTNATAALAASTIVSRDAQSNFSANVITANLAGHATSAARWTAPRTIALTGDITGSVSIDGSQNVVLSTSIANNSVALGTDTTGPYVSTVSAGSGGVTVTGGTGESAAVTVSTNATAALAASTIVMRDSLGNFTANVVTANVSGHVTSASRWTTPRTIQLTGPVTGSVSIDGSGNASLATTIQSSAIALGTNTTGSYVASLSGTDGITATYTGSVVIVSSNASSLNTRGAIVTRDAQGNFAANVITANVLGNATTALRLQKSVFINGQEFDGSGNVNVTLAAPSALIAGPFLEGQFYNGSTERIWNVRANVDSVGCTIVARDISGNFTAGTITASLAGNATTATRFQTRRTINNVEFDGTANVIVKAATTWPLQPGSGFAQGTSSFDGSTPVTWNLNTNTEPTASTIVLRDGLSGIKAALFTGNGSALTSLNAGQLSHGIVPIERLPVVSGLVATSYGGTLNSLQVSVDTRGRITSIQSIDVSSIPVERVSGIVPVSKGGTGVTSSTGTGSVVLSNSPTLTGSVGIGTTSTGNFRLEVNTDLHVGDDFDGVKYGLVQITRPANPPNNRHHLAFIRNGNSVAGLGYIPNSNTFGILHGNDNTSSSGIFLTSEGLVGIGKTNPATLLDVAGTVTATGGNFTGSVTIDGTVQSSLGYRVGDLEVIDASGNFVAGGLRLASASGEPALIVDASGNVGVQTGTPSESLDVSGFVQASQGLKINGNIVIDSSGTYFGLAAIQDASNLTGEISVDRFPNSGVTAGTYGSSNSTVSIQVDTKGRVTSIGSLTIPTATTGQIGLVRLNNEINSSDTTQAATANAVKAAYELALGRLAPNGNGSGLTNLSAANLTGTISTDRFPNSGVTAGTYGSSNSTVSIQVDTKGRVTSLSNITIPTATTSQIGLVRLDNLTLAGTTTTTDLKVNGALYLPTPAGDPAPVITARTVPAGQGNANEKTELILFHANDPTPTGSGVDTITLRAPGLRFQTYNNAGVSDINNNAGANDRLYIDPDGAASFSSTVSGTRFTSTVGTGTAPLAVSSTTLVNNLNAQFLNGLDSAHYLNAGNATGTLSNDRLPNSGVTATTYGSSTAVARFTVTAKGIITAADAVSIPTATTGQIGLVRLNNEINSSDTTQAATANAARVAYERGTQGINDAASANTNANNRVAKSGDTMTGTLTINNASPTITFQDTNHNSAFLHCNDNLLYVLRGGTNATSWTAVNGQWPWTFNLSNNDSTCGGSLSCIGTTTATRFISTVASGTAPLVVTSTTRVDNLNAQFLNGLDSAHYLNAGNATGTLSADRLPTSGVGAGAYGSSTASARVTVDAKGRVTGVSEVTIQPTWDNVQGKPSTFSPSSHSIALLTDAHRLWNNSGDNFATRTDFNATYDFGWRFVQGSTNGPGVNSASNYYSVYAGLGNDLPAFGTGSYGMQMAIPRNVSSPYIAIRYRENNVWTGWNRISAGRADTLTNSPQINGTTFTGSSSITTANWGTSRTLTIGNTGKPVNGSVNVSWSLSEIGAAPISHVHDASQITSGTFLADRLPTSGVAAGTYGASAQSAVITVDSTGRVTSAGTVAIQIPWSGITSGVPSASTGAAGIVQLIDSTTDASTTTAATPNSVKSANDNANNRLAKTGDALSGNLFATSTGWFSGNGWALSSLNASGIARGTLSADRLPTSGVAAGTYGSASSSVQVTVDARGRVTSIANAPISGIGASGVVAGSYGGSTNALSVTVDSTGRISSMNNAPIPTSTTGQIGLVRLNDTFTSADATQAATANMLKTAYDRASTGITDAANANTNANNRVAKSGDTMSGNLTINNASPTINFRDTDHNSAALHCNSHLLYVLRGGNNTTTMTQVNGQWPWTWNLTNNDSTCGGSLTCVGTTTATRFISTVASGTAPFAVTSSTLVNNLNADFLDNQHGDFYRDLGNATGTLSIDRLPNSGVTATTYGGSTASAVVTVDAKGRVTGASTITIQPTWDNVQGKPSTFPPTSHSIGLLTDAQRFWNNSGNNHGTYTDFNNSYDFGWRFIQGTANGPGVNSAGQYYSVYAGLGNDYPAFGTGSYGMQMAIPRNPTGSPYLSIRYRENGAWTGWNRVSAGRADTLTNSPLINGTAFSGSAAITTVTWGSSRRVTIGSTGKDVNGSVDVSWSLSEIGAAATNQTMHIGTTPLLINRGSGALTLNGVSISGSAGSVDWNNIANRPSTFTPPNTINRVRTDDSGGTHGSITISGAKNNYAGIHFSDVANTLMVTGAIQGFFTTGWLWYFENGVLTAGTVPWARLSGHPSVSAGDGLQGGGALSGTVTLSVNSSVVRTSRSIATGDGLSGGGDLSANRTLAVDASVVRTSGDQTIGGTKTFSSMPFFSSSSGNLTFANSGTGKRGIVGTCGDSDQWFFGGGATASNAGFLEIATGDDSGTEPIYVRQYSGAPPGGTVVRTLTLLDGSGNTSLPGTISGNGSGLTSLNWNNISNVPSLVYNNGGTYSINITGNSNYANSAGSANSVAWTNVSGKPTNFVYNDGGSYGINVTGSSGSCTGNSATATTSSFLSTNNANPNVRLASGAYENAAATTANGWPVTTNGWYHLMTSTHSNTQNNYSMQLAADFYSNTLFYRSTNGSGTTGWSQVVLNNGGSWGINITGSAGSVAWTNVSGRPTNFVFNDGGTYGINITGSSGSCTGNAATATRFQGNPQINGVTFVGNSNITVNGTAYNVNDGWLRRIGDSSYVQLYGNSRTMVFRTDGTTQYSDNGAYPFVWLYGGDNSGNRRMILDGNLWTSNYGWLHDRFGNVFSNGGTYNLSITGNSNYSNSTGYVEWNNVGNKPSTFTPSSHNHDASNITSGTLSVARGGTGQASLTAGKVLVGNGTSGILAPTELHWDNTNKRLGIGATSPSYSLHVLRSVNADESIVCTNSNNGTGARSTLALLNDFNGYFEASVCSSNSNQTFGGVSMTGAGVALRSNFQCVLTTVSAHPLYLSTNNAIRMTVTSGGSIGVGLTNPSYKFHVSGGDIACSADVIAFASDERLKTNVRTIDNALDKIDRIEGVHFDWIPEVHGLGFHPPRMTDEVGLLAQQVQKVVPQAVMPAPFDREGNRSKSGQDYLTVKYDKLVPLLLEGIKELRSDILELRRDNLELRSDILELRREIEDLKNAQKNRT